MEEEAEIAQKDQMIAQLRAHNDQTGFDINEL